MIHFCGSKPFKQTFCCRSTCHLHISCMHTRNYMYICPTRTYLVSVCSLLLYTPLLAFRAHRRMTLCFPTYACTLPVACLNKFVLRATLKINLGSETPHRSGRKIKAWLSNTRKLGCTLTRKTYNCVSRNHVV